MKKIAFSFACIFLIGFTACQKQEVTLKLMSYNIRHGEGMDGVQDLSRTAQIINTHAPHLCALQEIDNKCTRTNNIDQTSFLAQSTAMQGNFGAFMDFQGGAYGLANLTNLPISNTTVLALPDGLQEPRVAIVQEVVIAKNRSILFINVHFDWISGSEGSASRLKQAKALVIHLDALGKAAIITGDFNCTPQSPTMKYFTAQGFVFMQKGGDNLSFQGSTKAEIDHVIYRPSKQVTFIPQHIQLLNAPLASDHRPLIAELQVVY
jgi:endonuclease/exonuclease/phosphatase family metal-dependent hydrolase